MLAQPEIVQYPEAPTRRTGRTPRILVADDDASLVRLLKEDLELEGYNVSCAFDGMHAMHMTYEEKFDLIILDINMPITNGYKVLEYLRKRPETATTPIIVVTAEPSSDVYPAVAGDPRASYIKKPLEIESLNSLVRFYLKH